MRAGGRRARGIRGVDAVENAIRNALDKGDAVDPAFRLRVYQAAQAALERALVNAPPDQAQIRRGRLSAVVAAVEQEFQPALAATPSAARTEPRFPDEPRAATPGDLSGFRAHPDFGVAPAASVPEAPARYPDEARPAVRRRSIANARFFAAVIIVAALGLGAWWAVDTGLFLSPGERDTSVPNPPATVDGEDFAPKDDGAPQKPGEAEREWITVFTPEDAAAVQVPSGASAEVVGSGDDRALRIRSSAADIAVSFDVGRGVLEKLAGHKAVFDISARAEDGKTTQISVACKFGALGDCGRKRYEVGFAPGEFLFEIALPDRDPGGAGVITVIPDVSNGGKALDVLRIRAAASDPAE